MRKALFLDRDGVVNVEKNYVYQVEEFQFIDGIFDICLEFQKREYLIFIITNQAGIARSLFSERDFTKLTRWMLNQFELKGIKITEVFHCSHHPDFTGECTCRKPKPGMILEAEGKYNLDLEQSVLIGDKESDIKAGINARISKNILFHNSWEEVLNYLVKY